MAVSDSGAVGGMEFQLVVRFCAVNARIKLISVVAPMIFVSAVAFGQTVFEANCGQPDDSGGIGPFDLRDYPRIKDQIDLVVDHHFTPYMEDLALTGSTARQPRTKEELKSRGSLDISHLDYTLRAIPNHTRALNAMGAWQLRLRRVSMDGFWRTHSGGKFKTAECYFKRAIMFRPDDGSVRLAYGVFSHRQGQQDLALQNYIAAIRLLPESADAHYNIGLLYVKLQNFELARQHAKKAYELGYPLPGLRNTLMRNGEWENRDVGSGAGASLSESK